ncbi:MAG: flagellar biosynthetic protein FliR [Mariniblastus sp.]
METGAILLLSFARVAALVLTAPVLGSRAVPLKMRIGLAVLLTIATLPLIDGQTVSTQPNQIISALFSEVIIGAILGLGVMIMFSAAQAAGTVISQMAGIQIADSLDPQTGQLSSPVGQLFGMLSLAAFALIGGPELVIAALLDTFIHLPLGTSLETSRVLTLITELLQQSFILTLRGVAPAVAALMISTLVIGLISRTYPQMNLLGLGLSSNLIVMFLAISFTLGGCVWLFVDDLDQFIAMIGGVMQEARLPD